METMIKLIYERIRGIKAGISSINIKNTKIMEGDFLGDDYPHVFWNKKTEIL